MSADLPLLLLRLSDGGPAVLSGRRLKPWFGRPLDQLLARRVLVELQPAVEWPPCADCDQGCEARPILQDGERLIAACPYDGHRDDILTADDIRSFRIDVVNLCCAIRDDTGLIGDEAAEMGKGAWWLGSLPRSGRSALAVLLLLSLPDYDVADLLQRIKIQCGRDAVAVTTTMPGSAVRQQFVIADIPLLSAMEVLSGVDPVKPFALNAARLAAPPDPGGARLVIRTLERTVVFDGHSVPLAPQPFDLLVVLVERALDERTPMQRRDIENALFGTATHGHDISDIVRRLRDSLAPFVGGRTQADQLIQNRPRLGYLLNLRPSDIDIA